MSDIDAFRIAHGITPVQYRGIPIDVLLDRMIAERCRGKA